MTKVKATAKPKAKPKAKIAVKKPRFKKVKAKLAYEVAYQDIVELIANHAGQTSGLEILAIASNFLGKLLAMQDQRTVTREQALAVVAKNMELGNMQVASQMMKTEGNA